MKKVTSKKSMKKSATEKTVDDYLAGLPEDSRATLEKLRKTIKAAAPKATEGIAWQMPMYKQNGMLVGFAAFKNHCSFFPGTKAIAAHKAELKNYGTSKGTIRFPIGKPLPATLVKKLVKERIAENEKRAAEKEKKR
ncbi:MAG: DUF1801 domain-containing protein [Acidobacteriota bacterium]|nr:DUF1801 domain-containing protein [Acidobacteriota bacterium]